MKSLDPGKNGGCASLSNASVADAIKMPSTDREIIEMLRPAQGSMPEDIYLEDIVKYAGNNMPSSSMATYAGNFGFLRGVAMTHGHRLILVPPKKWQKALGLGEPKSYGSKTEWKNHLKNRAGQLFPHIQVTLATADALLILEAARRGLIG